MNVSPLFAHQVDERAETLGLKLYIVQTHNELKEANMSLIFLL